MNALAMWAALSTAGMALPRLLPLDRIRPLTAAPAWMSKHPRSTCPASPPADARARTASRAEKVASSADKLLAGIERARAKPLSRVLCALGIRGTGRSMSRPIARHFATMDAIRLADVVQRCGT